jgi:segregation and condensation protein A
MTAKHFVKLQQFEGPLDLLLQLIRVHELNIFDIDLVVLTDQYMQYLRLVSFKDLNDASSFIAMAATLIEVKSRRLLPIQARDQEGVEGEELEEEEDPAVVLQRRLLEYELFRGCSQFLNQQATSGEMINPSAEWERLSGKFAHIEPPILGETTTLLILYEQLLSTITERRPAKVEAETEAISLNDITHHIKDLVKKAKIVQLQGLYRDMTSRYELIAYFLAILQMVRDRELQVYQDELMGPIWLYEASVAEEQVRQVIDQQQPTVAALL